MLQMRANVGGYLVYRLYNAEINDFLTEFFLPQSNILRRYNRSMRLADLKDSGYKVCAVLHVDEETYLNMRINRTVEDYLHQDQAEREICRKMRRGEVSQNVFVDTVKLIKEHKWTLMKILDMQMRRANDRDFDVDNEIALQLHDRFVKELMPIGVRL